MQRTTQGLGENFRPTEKAPWEEFYPDLFPGAESQFTSHSIMEFTVKHSGLKIPNPTMTTQGNFKSSCVVTGHLVAALRGHV